MLDVEGREAGAVLLADDITEFAPLEINLESDIGRCIEVFERTARRR